MCKNMFKLLLVLVVAVVSTALLTGCYVNDGIGSNEVGLQMDDGVKITNVVGPGRYTNSGWYAEQQRMDVSAKTLVWEDSDLWTSDKQPVRFKVSITYARKRDKSSAQGMWETYNGEARNDELLASLVSSRVPRVAKQVTTGMTLDGMLGINDAGADKGREVLQSNLHDLLKPEMDEIFVDLLDIGVNDIGVDEDYANKLKEKAVSKVATELSEQKTLQLNDQIAQEKAQTAIDIEVAERKRKVLEEENKVYVMNPQAYELERLRLLKDVVGDKDKIYFIPQGTDLNLILSGSDKNITPVPVK